jgi:6-phosphogluconolactonase
MRLSSAVSGNRSHGCRRRRWWWWLGAVLAACLVGAASAQAQPFVYVADQGSTNVSQYAIGIGGALSPLSPETVVAGTAPTGVAVSPDGTSAYVTDQNDPSTVSQYSVDAVTGALSPKTPATVATGTFPFGIAVSPDGKNAYVASDIPANDVSQYSIDPVTGALSPKTPATVAAGEVPTDVAVTPDSKSAYVTNQFDKTVSQYTIDPVTGALLPKAPAAVAAGAQPVGVVVAPDGRSAYVTDSSANTVSQYTIDPLTGALSPKIPAAVETGGAPLGIAVTHDGRSAYVTNSADNTVSQYNIDPATGALSPKTPATVATDTFPFGIAVSPDGTSAYATNRGSNTISQYRIDPLTGALSPKTPATVATGSGPVGIAVTPLPTKHSTATSVSCSPSVFAPGDATVCKATVTDTATAGQSTPTGTVSFTNSGAGTLFGSPCTLSGSGPSASCAVFFASFPRGGRIIAAAFGGDTTHSPSGGFTGVTVAVPLSTNGCVVFGHGRITAANGDQASFRGLVATTPPRGVEFYRDNGPASAMRVVSTSVDAITCSDDATKASVFGTATVNGSGSVEYRIDVQLTAWEGGKDTYRLRLSNGYDSGVQRVRHGDLDIRIRDRDHHHHDANADHYKNGAGPDGG